MKKVEREFWVDESNLKHIINLEKVYCEPLLWVGDSLSNKAGMKKITISFEVPDNKITISESELERAFTDSHMDMKFSGPYFVPDEYKETVKQKLFGAEK